MILTSENSQHLHVPQPEGIFSHPGTTAPFPDEVFDHFPPPSYRVYCVSEDFLVPQKSRRTRIRHISLWRTHRRNAGRRINGDGKVSDKIIKIFPFFPTRTPNGSGELSEEILHTEKQTNYPEGHVILGIRYSPENKIAPLLILNEVFFPNVC